MLDRRAFLAAAVGLAGWLVWPGRARAASGEAAGLPAETVRALETSPYVYVSPLRSDGAESRCHGEVWYAWLDGRVVLSTGRDRWKARALARGLDRARLWVGDHGPWKRLGIANDAFRKAPHFDARAARVDDPEVLDRLMQAYRRKYPDEIGRWEPRMREGFASGKRVLIAYTPLPRSQAKG